MCQTITTLNFCSCSNGGSYAWSEFQGRCTCPDPCTELVIVSGPDETNSNGSCQCPIINGSAVGGALYKTIITTTFACDAKSPPPPGCTTPPPTTPPPPPPNTCNNGGSDGGGEK
jgi:hypothetical protein